MLNTLKKCYRTCKNPVTKNLENCYKGNRNALIPTTS